LSVPAPLTRIVMTEAIPRQSPIGTFKISNTKRLIKMTQPISSPSNMGQLAKQPVELIEHHQQAGDWDG
jgi:hypothetical protein